MSVEEDLEFDLITMGCCFWKIVDGEKVRIDPRDVLGRGGLDRDRKGELCQSITRVEPST